MLIGVSVISAIVNFVNCIFAIREFRGELRQLYSVDLQLNSPLLFSMTTKNLKRAGDVARANEWSKVTLGWNIFVSLVFFTTMLYLLNNY